MQDVDRITDVQTLPHPTWGGDPRLYHKAFRVVTREQDFHGIAGHFRSSRDLRQQAAVRTAEPKVAIGLPIDLVPLLVNGAMVTTTEHGEVRERRRAALRPVTDVMSLAEADSAARKATTAVSVVERAT